MFGSQFTLLYLTILIPFESFKSGNLVLPLVLRMHVMAALWLWTVVSLALCPQHWLGLMGKRLSGHGRSQCCSNSGGQCKSLNNSPPRTWFKWSLLVTMLCRVSNHQQHMAPKSMPSLAKNVQVKSFWVQLPLDFGFAPLWTSFF